MEYVRMCESLQDSEGLPLLPTCFGETWSAVNLLFLGNHYG